MYKILVTQVFLEPGNPEVKMTTTVISFDTSGQANRAADQLETNARKAGVHTQFIKLY